jgi:drug/metabolite transporter (DMT)-like permease
MAAVVEKPAAVAGVSPNQGRLCVILAAVLWSTSGAFTNLLREDTPLGHQIAAGLNGVLRLIGLASPAAADLHDPQIDPLLIAFGRVLFGGCILLPLMRRRDIVFRPVMFVTAIIFAAMNALFTSALAYGTSANAILLQYTAPMWMWLFCVFVLREPADWRGAVALVIGLTGIGVIIAGGWTGGDVVVVAIALGAGVTYAGVLLGLRMMRDLSTRWITVFNFLFSAIALLPFVVFLPKPSAAQVVVLFVFGALQLGLPYLLVARGLRALSPQEVGTLTLLEPLLNPLWAYLVYPEKEKPTASIFVGGAFILGGLVYRYLPRRGRERR